MNNAKMIFITPGVNLTMLIKRLEKLDLYPESPIICNYENDIVAYNDYILNIKNDTLLISYLSKNKKIPMRKVILEDYKEDTIEEKILNTVFEEMDFSKEKTIIYITESGNRYPRDPVPDAARRLFCLLHSPSGLHTQPQTQPHIRRPPKAISDSCRQ